MKANNYEYPKKSATFVLSSGEQWKDFNSGGPLYRELICKSTTDDSLIREFRILGYYHSEDHSTSIAISFSYQANQAEKLRKIFQKIFDIDITKNSYRQPSYIARESKEIKVILGFIKENNEIPTEVFSKIERIIQKGRFTPKTIFKPLPKF